MDKRAKKVIELGIIADKHLLKLLKSVLEHNLLQLGLQQLSRRLVIDFTQIFKQACEHIHVGTWVLILDA
jgi:hypothetical protein